MTNAFLKPARDAAGAPMLVRDPVTMIPLAEAGEWKTLAPYWIRRMRDKEVIDATADASAPVAAPAVVDRDDEPAVKA